MTRADPRTRAVVPLVSALRLPHGRRLLVLDDWRTAVLLQRRGAVVEAGDRAASTARRAVARGAFSVPYDPDALPFGDRRYDAVLCRALPDEAELLRVLRPGGRLGVRAVVPLPAAFGALAAPPGTTAGRLPGELPAV